MAAITYTARRSLVPGHVEGEEYSLEVAMSAIDPTTDAERDDHVALDGTTESLLTRIDKLWRFRTIPLEEPVAAQMREFLDSVLGGEAFVIDPYGTIADPIQPLTVKLASKRYGDDRHGTVFLYRFSFDVRVQP